MIHSSFFQNKYEAGEDPSPFNCVNGTGVIFSASHHIPCLSSFTIPLNKLFDGNTIRGKKRDFCCIDYDLFSSRSLLSLVGYKIIGRNGCTLMSSSFPPTFCGISDASTHLFLTYKSVCRKLFKGLKKGFGVIASKVKSVYVMLCYVIVILTYLLTYLREVIVFKSYDIQESMLCCRHNIAWCDDI